MFLGSGIDRFARFEIRGVPELILRDLGRTSWTFFTSASQTLNHSSDLILAESLNETGIQTWVTFAAGGNVGIGTNGQTPKAKLHVSQGDIYLATAGRGVILKSPDGTVCRNFTIDNSGNIVTAVIACP